MPAPGAWHGDGIELTSTRSCEAERGVRYRAWIGAAGRTGYSSSCVRRTSISRRPTWLAGVMMPSFSICSISLAALL